MQAGLFGAEDYICSDIKASGSFKSLFVPWWVGYWLSLIANNRNYSLLSSENSQSPVVEAGGSHGHMSPEEHCRRMMSVLSEQGSYEEQHQRLYQLASSMGLQGHGQYTEVLFFLNLCWCSNICSALRYMRFSTYTSVQLFFSIFWILRKI